jgi:hypothetical protein
MSSADDADEDDGASDDVVEAIDDLWGRLVSDLATRSADLGSEPKAEPKPADTGDERDRRRNALRRVRAAITVRTAVAEASEAALAAEAANAVWLGASLADLAALGGHTRQAARKRWPALGAVYRRRTWLSDHLEDLVAVCRLVFEARPGLRPDPAPPEAATSPFETPPFETPPFETVAFETVAFDTAMAELGTALGRLRGAFDADATAAPDINTGADATRWHAVDNLVNITLRRALALAGPPRTAAAEFAAAGCHGMLAHYDAATAEPAKDPAPV